MPLAQLSSVAKSFSRNIVLCGINLTIERGELIAVLGTNGAGKTTLLRLLAGLLGLSSGELCIDGSPLDRLSETQREKLFFLPDFPVLFDDLSVLENVETWLSLYHREPDQREEASVALLDRFDLMEKAHLLTATLSRGQRYKLALVLYQGSQAPLGLFDEPFASGMDVPGIREMRKILRQAVADQRSIIYTTQLATYAREFADRILVIHDSSIHFDGSPSDFDRQLQSGDPVLQIFSESDE
jgi:ABC-type multidrug transport system ATPase subunit